VRITPLDIRKHPFPRRLSGYDREEVDTFMRMVAEDFEAVVREADSLRDKVARLQTRVEDLAANETVLQETLVTAQKLSEDLKRTAVREAEVLISEAEIKGEKILDAAHRRAAKLAQDIREMKSLRARLHGAVRTAIETHLSLLDALAQDDSGEPALENRVALPRKQGESPAGGGG
jgi:cell division initiation protein